MKWGWFCLIVGVVAQLIGIWLPQPVAKNLTQPSEMSWETLKLIMETQDKLATYGLIVLGVVIAAMVLSNVFILTYPERKINKTREDLEKKIQTEATVYFEKSKQEIVNVKGEIKDETEKLLLRPKADINMLVGITAGRGKIYDAAATNFAAAVRDYNKLGDNENIRIALKTLYEALNNCKKLENIRITNIGRIVSEVSDLSSDKKPILDRLKKFQEDSEKNRAKGAHGGRCFLECID